MTADTAAAYLGMVDPHDGCPASGGMTGGAVIAGGDMRGGLGTAFHPAAWGMAIFTGGGCAGEQPAQVAAGAVNSFMVTRQWKAGAKVIEVITQGKGWRGRWRVCPRRLG